MFIKGMPRVFDSETHGTGSLELLVPCRHHLLESVVRPRYRTRQGLAEQTDIGTQSRVIETARDEDQDLILLYTTEKFFQQICNGTLKHHGRPIILVDASDQDGR
jgi:hypothetical protein